MNSHTEDTVAIDTARRRRDVPQIGAPQANHRWTGRAEHGRRIGGPTATAQKLHVVRQRETLRAQMWRPEDDAALPKPVAGSYIAPWMCRSGQCGGEWTPRGSAAAGRCLRCGTERPAAPDARAA